MLRANNGQSKPVPTLVETSKKPSTVILIVPRAAKEQENQGREVWL